MLKAINLKIFEATSIFDSSSFQKAIGFLSTGSFNFFGSLSKGIELQFSLSEVSRFLDNGVMGKSVHVTAWEVFQALNIQALLFQGGGTVYVASSNLPLMLGAFGVIMSVVALSFVLVHKRKEDEDRE
jgi:hypothetical protein